MAGKLGVNGGPQITWVNIIATLALLATLAGGAWLLFQNQFANLEQQMRDNARSLESDIRDNRTELERLRDRAILRDEHKEFVKRVDAGLSELKKRLDVIEATRPTAGEIAVGASSLTQRVDVLRESIADLRKKFEATPFARNPVEEQQVNAEVSAINKRLDMLSDRINAWTAPPTRTIESPR